MCIRDRSLPVVGLTAVFTGAALALQIYSGGTRFNAESVVPSIVAIGICRELGPVLCGLIMAGRDASSISDEIGTMKVTEQIDALEVMGVNSSSYLVLPKIIAALLMFPILVVISATLAIFGGYTAGVLTDVITGQEYIYGLRYEFNPFNIPFALIKSYVFAFIVASVSSFQGYYTSGGALEVGKSSTNAVTNSCIAILIDDYILAQILL